jgi:hypothetical protein
MAQLLHVGVEQGGC